MNKSLFDLTGTTALVTGCNKGIGKGMAFGLAEAGANIIGVSATMPLQGSDVGNGITQLGRNFKAYQSDFSDRQNLYEFSVLLITYCFAAQELTKYSKEILLT